MSDELAEGRAGGWGVENRVFERITRRCSWGTSDECGVMSDELVKGNAGVILCKTWEDAPVFLDLLDRDTTEIRLCESGDLQSQGKRRWGDRRH